MCFFWNDKIQFKSKYEFKLFKIEFINFSKLEFVKQLKPYIVAIELSHNNGIEDQHLPLKKNAWYWKIINDPDFSDVYKILEFRNTNIKDIKKIFSFF
mgnify:CR=1 FL=1